MEDDTMQIVNKCEPFAAVNFWTKRVSETDDQWRDRMRASARADMAARVAANPTPEEFAAMVERWEAKR